MRKLLALFALVPAIALAQPSSSKVDLSRVGGASFGLGQNTKVNSLSCAIASDQEKTGVINPQTFFGVGTYDTDSLTWEPLYSFQGALTTSTQNIFNDSSGIYSYGAKIGGVVDDTGTSTVSENGSGVIRITPYRGQHVNLRNNSGAEIGISSAPLRTDPTGTTTQPISAASLPLPTGAATSALQTTGNTSLSSLDSKTTVVNTGSLDASTTTQSGSITASGQSISIAGSGPTEIRVSGTYTNIALTFEATTDGSQWKTVSALRMDTGVQSTTTGTMTNISTLYRIPGHGWTNVRVRSTNYSSGTMSVTLLRFGKTSESGVVAYQAGTWSVNAAVTGTTTLIGGNKVHWDTGEVSWSSISGAYTPVFTTSGNTAFATMLNTMNKPLWVSFDSGSTDTVPLPANMTAPYTIYFTLGGVYAETGQDVMVRETSEGTPTTGRVYITGSYE